MNDSGDADTPIHCGAKAYYNRLQGIIDWVIAEYPLVSWTELLLEHSRVQLEIVEQVALDEIFDESEDDEDEDDDTSRYTSDDEEDSGD